MPCVTHYPLDAGHAYAWAIPGLERAIPRGPMVHDGILRVQVAMKVGVAGLSIVGSVVH